MVDVLLVYCVENYIQVSQARYKEGKKYMTWVIDPTRSNKFILF
jgi:hypothetical protein